MALHEVKLCLLGVSSSGVFPEALASSTFPGADVCVCSDVYTHAVFRRVE